MPSANQLVIFPGSFDPFTLGHLDIVRRAARLFDRVDVAVGVNESKKGLLNADERLRLAKVVTDDLKNVEVNAFRGLVAEYAASRGATALIRGLRQSGDFEYEVRMAHANARLAEDMETIFIPASAAHAFISSTIVRDIHRWGGDVSPFVPAPVVEALSRLGPQT